LDLLERGLSGSELTSLLLSVARARAAAVTPALLLASYAESRFTTPANVDPRRLVEVERRLWAALPPEFDGVALSPVAPLGACSAVGPVDQNVVVSTTRGSEVVSDATNVLALEAALRRRQQDRDGVVHLAASHRVLRAQVFDAPDAYAHFHLFNLVSSARDRGSGETEADLMSAHLAYWCRVLCVLAPQARFRLGYRIWRAGAVAERFRERVLPDVAATGVEVYEDTARTRGDGYYRDVAVAMYADGPSGEVEFGDGGLTNWTAQLMGDAKERCLTSCISTERVLGLMTAR
jgi:hypothetical protein